jgi:hypothetical protein
MARSKWAKRAWLKENLEGDFNFLPETTLPDSDPHSALSPDPSEESVQKLWLQFLENNREPVVFVGIIPDSVRDFFSKLYDAVMGGAADDVQRLTDRYLAQRAFNRAIGIDDAADCPYYDALARVIWRESLNGRSGSILLDVCEKALEVRQKTRKVLSCSEAAAIAIEGIKNAQPNASALSVMAEKYPNVPRLRYAIAPGPSETYIAFARFMHLPQDMLVVQAGTVLDQRNEPQLKVVGFAWMPIQ